MRQAVIVLSLVAALLVPATFAAAAQPGTPLGIAIVGVEMADSHSLQVEIADRGLPARTPRFPAVTVTAWPDGVPARASLPLINMPPRFAMRFDLAAHRSDA